MLIILCATYEDPNPGRGRAVRWFARIAEIATAECYKTPTQFRTGELAGTPAQGWSQDPSPEHDWRQLEGLVSLVSVRGRNWRYSCGKVERVETGEIIEIASIHAVFMHVAENMVG